MAARVRGLTERERDRRHRSHAHIPTMRRPGLAASPPSARQGPEGGGGSCFVPVDRDGGGGCGAGEAANIAGVLKCQAGLPSAPTTIAPPTPPMALISAITSVAACSADRPARRMRAAISAGRLAR